MGVMDPVERVFGAVNSTVFRQVNRARDWWQLPTPVALLNLRAHRDDLRVSNLYDTRPPANGTTVPLDDLPKYRTYDGSRQDPIDPRMGMVGSRFGRNAPTDATAPEPPELQMQPSPREVANRLLSRWWSNVGLFAKVFPKDYKRVLEAQRDAMERGVDADEAIMAAARG